MRRKIPSRCLLESQGIEVMPAISMRQPWAWAVMHAGKNVENRARRTNIRGRFAIQAAKGCEPVEYRRAVEWMVALGLARSAVWPDLPPLKRTGIPIPTVVIPPLEEMPRGVLVGTAELTGIIARECESPPAWKMAGLYGYTLKDVRPVVHKPVDGCPGWFYVPKADVVETSRSLIEAVSPTRFKLEPGAVVAQAVECVRCGRTVDSATMTTHHVMFPEDDLHFTVRASCHGETETKVFTKRDLEGRESPIRVVYMFGAEPAQAGAGV